MRRSRVSFVSGFCRVIGDSGVGICRSIKFSGLKVLEGLSGER